MKRVTFFGCGVLAVFLLAAAISVYGFGQYEHAWGRGGSFQVEAWLALIGALVATGAFGISSAAFHRVQTQAVAFVLGLACALAYIVVCWGFSDVSPSGGAYIAFLLLVVVGVLASFAGTRVGG